MRSIPAAMQTQLDTSHLFIVWFAHVQGVTGDLRLWTGIGTVSWNGYTWTGAGDLGSVRSIRQTKDLRAEGIELQLSGIGQDNIAFLLTEMRSGRDVQVWLGFEHPTTRAILADPMSVYKGYLDTGQLEDGRTFASVIVRAEGILAGLERAVVRRYTHEDQQIDYPGDRGFEYVAAIQDKEVLFGG